MSLLLLFQGEDLVVTEKLINFSTKQRGYTFEAKNRCRPLLPDRESLVSWLEAELSATLQRIEDTRLLLEPALLLLRPETDELYRRF